MSLSRAVGSPANSGMFRSVSTSFSSGCMACAPSGRDAGLAGQLAEQARPRGQLLVRAVLGHLAGIEDHHAVVLAGGGQPPHHPPPRAAPPGDRGPPGGLGAPAPPPCAVPPR